MGFLFNHLDAQSINEGLDKTTEQILKGQQRSARHLESTVNYLNTDVQQSEQTLLFFEDFESFPDGWDLGLWEIGVPLSGPFSAISSDSVLATNLDGLYQGSSTYTLITNDYELPTLSFDASVLSLEYWEWFQIETGYDEGRIEISTDGGNTYTVLAAFDGSINEWQKRRIDLTAYQGETVRFRYVLVTDSSFEYDGWYLDDFALNQTDPEPLSMEIIGINTQAFPFVYMNVIAQKYGVSTADLDQSNFTIYENGTQQSEYVEVTPPGSGDGSRLVDIVFVMDNSGSLEEEQAAISDNILDFVNQLETSGVDFALGLTRFGAYENLGNPILEDNGVLTSNSEYFKNNVWNRNVVTGSYEPAYQSIIESSRGFNFRPGALKVIVVIADEKPDQSGLYNTQDVINQLSPTSTILYALADSYYFDDFSLITDATNGETYDILSDFSQILESITEALGGTYLVRYRSSDDLLDGQARNIVVSVNADGLERTDTISYTPGSTPEIVLTEATNQYFQKAWSEQSTFQIEAYLLDSLAPYPASAKLFYKNSNDVSFQSVEMSYQSTSGVWLGYTDPSVANDPGVDFYITTSDGITSVSLPSDDPSIYPFQIAILPNEAPTIIADTISEIEIGETLQILATVEDQTNYLTRVSVLYRQRGNLSYQEMEMVALTNVEYETTIPSSSLTSLGLEYFIIASDDFGITTFDGTPDNPHTVFIKDYQIIETASFDDQNIEDEYVIIEAISDSGLPVKALVTDTVYFNGDTLWFEYPGPVQISFVQAGNAGYFPADTVSVDFCVNPEVPDIFYQGSATAEYLPISGEVLLLANGGEGSFKWYRDGVNIAEAESLKVNESGIYILEENVSGCFRISNPLQIDFILSAHEARYLIYPNPSRGIFHLPPSNNVKVEVLGVYSVAGESMPYNTYNQSLDLTSVDNGVYILQMRIGARTYSIKLTKAD